MPTYLSLQAVMTWGVELVEGEIALDVKVAMAAVLGSCCATIKVLKVVLDIGRVISLIGFGFSLSGGRDFSCGKSNKLGTVGGNS